MEFLPLAEPVKGKRKYFSMRKKEILFSFLDYNYYHRRKSAVSQCTQAGIYPDVLDCSLFHYCHPNKQHEILRCPKGLHFDPKLFICSAIQLVGIFHRIIKIKISHFLIIGQLPI